MRLKLGTLLLGGGLLLVFLAAGFYLYEQYAVNQSLRQAERLLLEARQAQETQADLTSTAAEHSLTPEALHELLLKKRQAFTPEKHEEIGILEIPRLQRRIPIVEGTDEKALRKGVGHYDSTAFPTDGKQILLSGHRDGVFRQFGDLQEGDEFIVHLPYGSFVYEIRSSLIVDKDDTSVIRSMGEEVLTVSTCYPFSYVGNAPERYVLYAYPVEAAEDAAA